MPRQWQTEFKVENDRIVELKRLIRFGNGYALVLPKDWVWVHCGNDHKVEIDVDGGTITLKGYKEATE